MEPSAFSDFFSGAWRVFEQGGFMMWPLLFCSVSAFALIAERTYTLRAEHLAPPNVVIATLSLLHDRSFTERDFKLLPRYGATGQLLHLLLSGKYNSRAQAERVCLTEGQTLELRLERYTHLLGTIAVISPLMGLLGTVFGMISVFHSLTENGGSQSGLADGLSVALLTTAFGLIIAIPSTFAFRFFNHKSDLILSEFYTLAQTILDALFPEKTANSPPPPETPRSPQPQASYARAQSPTQPSSRPPYIGGA